MTTMMMTVTTTMMMRVMVTDEHEHENDDADSDDDDADEGGYDDDLHGAASRSQAIPKTKKQKDAKLNTSAFPEKRYTYSWSNTPPRPLSYLVRFLCSALFNMKT